MNAKPEDLMPFRDPSRPIEERLDDLLSRFTLEEKITQLLHVSQAVPRLGIPEYDWWNECLHGVARAGRATVFPQAIGLAATFDTELLQRIGSAIADEARAKYNAAQRAGNRGRYRGLTFWSPNINIFRDPRWGRGQETYGEDPCLTAALGVAFVKGLQGDDPVYLKVAACAKHFAAHSGPETQRHSMNVEVSSKDLQETYLPAFKALVDAGVESVMGAFTRLNGEPCCASKFLLVETLRRKWGFRGHVVSDCWALVDIHESHHVTATPEESLALALTNGCDLNCGCVYSQVYLVSALKQGLITENHIDNAVRNVYRTRFKLGMFDPPERVPYSSLGDEVVDCQKHRDIAYEAAVKSVVCLKNRNRLLPIDKGLKNIYVFGSLALDNEVLLGNYNGHSSRLVSILEGIIGKAEIGTTVRYHRVDNQDRMDAVTFGYDTEVGKSDLFVVVMGITPQDEGEQGADAGATAGEGDRRDINLPANQTAFIKDLAKSGKPLVVILTAGSQLIITEIMEAADAILYVWYPGEEGGNAVADILFGTVSPSGKLPVTFPSSLDQLPDFTDYSMKNRTYRYMQEPPLFPFGFGLSYTSFQYGPIVLSSQNVKDGESVTAEVTVTNSGDGDGEEVVQLYLQSAVVSPETPVCSLKGFQRIALKAGRSTLVRFVIRPDDMKLIDDKGESVRRRGPLTIVIGGSSPVRRSLDLGAPAWVNTTVTLA